MSTQTRVAAGVPTGGQFAHTPHSEAATTLTTAVGDGQACAACGKQTKRKSGLCRNCDPTSKKNRGGASTTTPVAGVDRTATSDVIYDTEAGSLTPDEVGQCTFQFVPVYRNGKQAPGQTRPCKNAVRLPAERCHRHGGAVETSLGRTVARATAQAERGECFPLAAEHWEQADERLEAAQGQLLRMLETDTSQLATMMVAFRRQQAETSVGRMSISNQMLILCEHYEDIRREHSDADPDGEIDTHAIFEEAIARAAEPHMTEKNWAKHGREVTGQGAAAMWWKPGRSKPAQRPGESDEDYEDRTKNIRRGRAHFGAVIEYPLSATSGDEYVEAQDPLDTPLPPGHGDPEATITTLSDVASDMGISVEFVPDKPGHGYAYWQANENKIVVWSGIADGDRRAVAHSLAHELGHARLGHLTQDQTEEHGPEKEMAAESFAALVCAHHGIDSAAVSAQYITDWRSAQGIVPGVGGVGPFRSAVEAFDDYVTATSA